MWPETEIRNQRSEVRNQGSGVSQKARGEPQSPPPYYGQRDHGCHEWEKMPIFMAFLSAYPLSNRLDNGTTDDRPGIHKKALCVSGAQCNPFWAVVPG